MIALFLHFLAIYIHIPHSIDTILRFAGKFGEAEAYRAYKMLQPWSQRKEARIAIYHAGQVLCAAKQISPYQLRGSDSMIVWHAVMVLWTWSMMRKARDKRSSQERPTNENKNENEPSQATTSSAPTHNNDVVTGIPASAKSIILLDDPLLDQMVVDSFILTGSLRPFLLAESALRSTSQSKINASTESHHVVSLEDPAKIMDIGIRILERSHPDVERKDGPPMARSLCALLEELGGLCR